MAMDPFEPDDSGQGFSDPSAASPSDSPTPPRQVPYPTPGPPAVYPEESKAVVALVLSILGLFVCGVLSPAGWYYGRQETEAIDAGRRDPSKRDMATAGKVIGIIGTAILAFIVLGVLLAVGIAIVSVSQGAS